MDLFGDYMKRYKRLKTPKDIMQLNTGNHLITSHSRVQDDSEAKI